MKDEARANQFNGYSKEGQRRLLVAVNNITPAKRSFSQIMNSLKTGSWS